MTKMSLFTESMLYPFVPYFPCLSCTYVYYLNPSLYHLCVPSCLSRFFQVLEHPAEVENQEQARKMLLEQRSQFLHTLNDVTSFNDSTNMHEYQRVLLALRAYEQEVASAVDAGVSPVDPHQPHYQWNYIESVFFASTVITTIGYGNMAPVTAWGRFFCILYGFVGIPVTLSVIADLGTIFANMVLAISKKFRRVAKNCAPFKELKLPGEDQSRGLIVFGSVLALLVYIAIGGALFIQWEDWSFFEAFYFCFITMTTIGLGDLVPERTEFMLVCTIYILIGLALTSTIIELVRRQYAESWQQMKEFSGKLGELSGPLAEHLRRIGEQAGELNMDVHLLKDLKDLKTVITLSKLEALTRMDPKLRTDARLAELLKSHLSGDEGAAFLGDVTEALQPNGAKRKVIQVVIYESSV
ncbi:TWiK family of potassium channels protein 7-like [Penaeus chinensis]|uniref:TWiK family of potassium channels protein 7-like n=1 Tax=Penaeus chinensis TaxID=139456 RepID=UPI001FB80767|nr:TWiK family of potassium channels protein 7-like [Penaeus chinensis]